SRTGRCRTRRRPSPSTAARPSRGTAARRLSTCTGEPGRGFFQDVALLAERPHLAPEPPQLLALFRGQAILAVAVVAISLDDPVADRLRRRLELLRQLFRGPPGSHQLHEPPLELRRRRGAGTWASSTPLPAKAGWCPRNLGHFSLERTLKCKKKRQGWAMARAEVRLT